MKFLYKNSQNSFYMVLKAQKELGNKMLPNSNLQ